MTDEIPQAKTPWGTTDKVIGFGAFGVVYSLQAKGASGKVHPLAVKVIQGYNSSKWVDKVSDEIAIMQKLKGLPNIAEIMGHHVGGDDLKCFILMQRYEYDMKEYLRLHRKFEPKSKTIPRVAKMMLKCLAACHSRGVVHFDLKDDAFLFKDGECYLADFGLSKSSDTGKIIYTGELVYGPNAAPELLALWLQHNGHVPNKHITPTTDFTFDTKFDVWAVGEILAEMVLTEYACIQDEGTPQAKQITEDLFGVGVFAKSEYINRAIDERAVVFRGLLETPEDSDAVKEVHRKLAVIKADMGVPFWYALRRLLVRPETRPTAKEAYLLFSAV